MIYIEFPITSELRAPLLIIEWIFMFFGFEIGFIFLLRYFKQDKELRNRQEFGYFSLFIGFGTTWFFFILGDYYSSAEIMSPFMIWKIGSQRMVYLNIGYYTLMIFALIYIYNMERYKVYLIKKYFFTIIFTVLIIGFTTVFFVDMILTQTLSMLFWPFFILFFLIFMIDFIRKVQNNRKLAIGLLKFLTGFVFLMVGFLFTTDRAIAIFGFEGRLLGDVLQLAAMGLIAFFFITLPPFAEFDWNEKIEDIFILDKSGICLYHKIFADKSELIDENLIAGAISSINIMLKELTEDSGISVIKKKGKTVTISPSKYVYGVAFCKEDLNYIKVVLKNFVQKFEMVYGSVLKNWDGDVEIFKPAENIAKEIFLK